LSQYGLPKNYVTVLPSCILFTAETAKIAEVKNFSLVEISNPISKTEVYVFI